MSDESNNHNLIVGAAVVAGILGTLSTLLKSNKTVKCWTDQAKDAACQLMDKGEVNKNLLIGGVAGGLIGATAALLLAPKAGCELLQDIAHTLTHPGELIHPTSRKSSSRKSSRSKNVSSKAHKKEESKSGEKNKSRKSSSKKKATSRRRTAVSALKGSAEKIANDLAENSA